MIKMSFDIFLYFIMTFQIFYNFLEHFINGNHQPINNMVIVFINTVVTLDHNAHLQGNLFRNK